MFRDDEIMTVKKSLVTKISAPMDAGTQIGSMDFYIGDSLYKKVPIVLTQDATKVDFFYIFKQLLTL